MKTGVVEEILEKIQRDLMKRFGGNLKCLVLYGSWAKGTAREDSDIDLLAIFDTVDEKVRKEVTELSWMEGREVTLLTSSVEDFQREKIPLYTAIKREGSIIWGDVDRKISSDPAGVKYEEFFRKSQEFESHKLEMAEWLLERDFFSSIPEYCFIAAKHTIQAALAMRGEGYSSKMAVLLPLTERHFGYQVAAALRKLFQLYQTADKKFDSISRDDARSALEQAREVLQVYEMVQSKGD